MSLLVAQSPLAAKSLQWGARSTHDLGAKLSDVLVVLIVVVDKSVGLVVVTCGSDIGRLIEDFLEVSCILSFCSTKSPHRLQHMMWICFAWY